MVIGDIMLDEYIYGNVDRISPEAPVPVVAVNAETRVCGGAANVAMNLRNLGAHVVLAGFIGDDRAGNFILKELRREKIETDCVITNTLQPTGIKTRIIAHNQHVVRVDRERAFAVSESARITLTDRINETLPRISGVILSDYRKGVLSAELVSKIIFDANKDGRFIVVDPKQPAYSFYNNCTVITPNKHEAGVAVGRTLRTDTDVWKAGRELLSITHASAVLITRGAEGMTLVERGVRRTCFQIPAIERAMYDATGAGDTVIATFAAAMATGATLRESAMLANIAASVVVGELGTSAITAGKLMNITRTLRRREFRPYMMEDCT